MNRPKKQFCLRGHDTFICGRYGSNRCIECVRLTYVPVIVDTRKTQFCPKGHDKDITGRDTGGQCSQCRRDKHIFRPRSSICPQGHDKDIVGREKNGGCVQCHLDRSRIDPTKDSRFTQFCPKGHDKDIVGRTKTGRCKKCKQLSKNENRQKNYIPHPRKPKQFCPKNHDTFIVGRDKNGQCTECSKIKSKEYREKHKEEIKASQAKWKDENREAYNDYQKNLYHTDINHKLASRLRNRINDVLKGKVKVSSVIDMLGCDLDFLRKYIESLWLPGMNWDNWSKFGWHIDHKNPLDSFDLTDPIQFAKAVHYTNLQPMWAPDNWSKSNKIL